MEETIASDNVQIERKQFFFDLKENRRGILLRITEEVGGHRDTIILPATGLREFADALNRMIDILESEDLDPSDPTQQEGGEDQEDEFYEEEEEEFEEEADDDF